MSETRPPRSVLFKQVIQEMAEHGRPMTLRSANGRYLEFGLVEDSDARLQVIDDGKSLHVGLSFDDKDSVTNHQDFLKYQRLLEEKSPAGPVHTRGSDTPDKSNRYLVASVAPKGGAEEIADQVARTLLWFIKETAGEEIDL